MKYWLIFTGFIFLTACDQTEQKVTGPKPKADKKETKMDLKSKAAQHIKGQLKLTGADKFDTTWYSHDITGDGTKDYIITVNLLDRALNEAIAQNKQEKMEEMGYMGYFNHFFFVDGATEEISDAVVVPSSPMYQLDVTFADVLGVGRTDFYVDYRVRNMQRRKFYTTRNNAMVKEVYQSVIFDGLGTEKTVAYDVRLEEGTLNDFNDIVEYEAKLEDTIIPNLDSTYSYTPTITPTDNEIRRWHYTPVQGKYFMVKK